MSMSNTIRIMLILAGIIACFQPLALVLAQTQSAVPTRGAPLPPSNQNTPGLAVVPSNGMAIYQESIVYISAVIGGRPISSAYISISKAESSSNTTIADIKGLSIRRLVQSWNVTAADYPIGDYYLQLIVTPNTTSIIPPLVVSTTGTPVPTSTARPALPTTLPSIYYWRAWLKGSSSSAAALVTFGSSTGAGAGVIGSLNMRAGLMAILQKMSIALGALALGCIITL
ncbi:hypothetical protein BCR41DRAFT_357369 [Lobosporangium transversale]|uniref:Ser-Thr-rich glycosyl-phosphatidyl-inositol-anchored membrane family-domain-containing protein n=1 Tax=Lobosporangium transversale TaxID=64571 RepID=A0A1Y2GJ08_9FUNG|nr:hypothetical protein BCR41DRAFT_357369 [Lobosporangium transversale]ORZ11021.1 hypothetical protein BCR41DRAFT_357369 [Lobosporangium transversale]|eukprot:XP_021879538.1 hypothetical protein BCR41DRAFT_357369 [Lobosporangium transversale]